MIRAIQFQNKRVGSTFLQQAIDSHTDIVGIDEIFVNVARKNVIRKSGFIPYIRFGNEIPTPREYIEDVIYKTYPDKKGISMKIMYNQVEYHAGLFDYIIRNKIPIIHVMRKNLLKQVISFYKMAENNHKPLNISADRLLQEVKSADRENEKWKKIFKHNIKLTLYYEDIIGETIDDKTYLSNNANIAICDFFKVKQQQLFATTKKKNKDDISLYLPNFKDVEVIFRNTKYEYMV